MKLIVAATIAALSIAGCSSNDDCAQEQVSKRLTINEPADPALQLSVDSCRVDVDACPSLCALALERVKIQSFGVNGCKVGFADAKVLMDVDYTPTSSNCFFGVGDDIAQPAPNGGGL
jgi:outer membrane murein-binding lipoprotein Lpp